MMRTKVLEDLIKKYKLTRPVSSADRRRILKSKRKTLSKIVKSEIYDSSFVSAAVLFDHLLNRFGMKTTLAGGARAFTAAAVIVFLVMVSSSLTVFYNYKVGRWPLTVVTGVPEYQKGLILMARGEVKVIRNKKEISALKTEEKIITKDKIYTGADGRVLFQMEKSLVHMMPGSSAAAGIELRRKSISLRKGTVLCKVRSLNENEEFKVITPNAEAVVAGTLFSVSYEKETTRVTVSRGAVKVTSLINNQEIHVEEGQSAVISGTSISKEPEKTGSPEMRLLEKFDRLKYREDMSGTETMELRRAVMALEKVKKKENKKRISTLDDIRKIYGRLEEIRLYNGRTYTGAIISRGSIFTIVTVRGTRKVRAKEVKNVRIIE
jgi:hypothetical protein